MIHELRIERKVLSEPEAVGVVLRVLPEFLTLRMIPIT